MNTVDTPGDTCDHERTSLDNRQKLIPDPEEVMYDSRCGGGGGGCALYINHFQVGIPVNDIVLIKVSMDTQVDSICSICSIYPWPRMLGRYSYSSMI